MMNIVLVWLGIMVVFLVIEAITVGLATIWFAAGAFVAMIAAALGVGVVGQVALFFAVSLALLIFTRPVAVRYINPHKVRTNYERVLNRTVKITESVNNKFGTGAAVLDGMDWTARAQSDETVLKEGEYAKVVAVEGVKLILTPLDLQEKELGR